MKICEYGCGNEAKFQFKNGKWCCSSHRLKCPNQKRSLTGVNNPFFGKKHSNKTRQKSGEKNIGRVPWNKGVERTEEEKIKISEKTREAMNKPEIRELLKHRPTFSKNNHSKWTGGYYSKGIPLYNTYASTIDYAEECRRSNEDRNVLEVKCTYCGSWFVPTIRQVYERRRALEGKNYGEQRLYCSDNCKHECPIFHQISYSKDNKPDSSREVQPELRQMRFKKDNYTCQKCKKYKEELECGLHCHHIEGIRWEPLESADIDKCITVCKICHNDIHKKEGCYYTDMRCN